MGELYDESAAVRRREERKAASRRGNYLFLALVAVLILAAAGIVAWRKFHDPATAVLNLNTATAVQLETLPGVGPETAHSIIKGRPYQTVEDVKNVKGIGEKTFEKMKPRIKVD
jgi:competence protein ComEA